MELVNFTKVRSVSEIGVNRVMWPFKMRKNVQTADYEFDRNYTTDKKNN